MNGSFFVYGHDLIGSPDLTSQSTGGQDDAGGITLNAGSTVFDDAYVIEFVVENADAAGELSSASSITTVRVYASSEDYLTGTALYTYSPDTGQTAIAVQDDPGHMGDLYLALDLSGFVADDPSAPDLGDLLILPGSDAVNAGYPQSYDHHSDVDLDGDGAISSSEAGNGAFNLSTASSLYAPEARGNGIVEGTEGADYIDASYLGDPESDVVDGGDGPGGSNDDVISAGAGNDTVHGSEGNDSIDGGLGDDQLEGGDGNDTLIGAEGDDRIYAGTGDDSGQGGSGNDSFEAYDGNDYFDGGDGDDWMNGDRGDDTLIGGDGNDWMRASYGNDYMEGGRGDDFIWSGYNDDTIRLENDFGNDTIEMEGVDEVYGDVLDLSAITDDLSIDLTGNVFGNGTISDGTSTASFDDVEHLVLGSGRDTIVLSNFSGYDAVEGFTAPVENADGSYTSGDLVDVSSMTNDDGDPVTLADVTVSDDGDGNAQLTFPHGETLVLVGVSPADLDDPAALVALGIPAAGLDGYVGGSDGDDLIDSAYSGDAEGDRIDAGDALDPSLGVDADFVYAGQGNDTVRAGAGQDTVYGDYGDDLLEGESGNDSLLGEAGQDSLLGGDGDDTLLGGDGDDELKGGAGEDWLQGQDGNDILHLDSGDIAHGDGGDDWFAVNASDLDPDSEMTVVGGETDEGAGDTLYINGPATITYTDPDEESGYVTFQNGSTLNFSEIETVKHVPCFTADSRISTSVGELPAAELRVGDRVMTRDSGPQVIRWVGQRQLSRAELRATPALRPVRISAGALGPNTPARDLVVSPQHRMLVCDPKLSLWFGEDEVFVPAIQLCCLDGVEQLDDTPVTYVHFMFDAHQLVLGDGAWSESFQPGDLTLAGMDGAQRQELLNLFPDLAQGKPGAIYPAARITLSGQESRALFA